MYVMPSATSASGKVEPVASFERGQEHCTTMASRLFLRFLAVFAIAVMLSACGRTESYSYKLTLAVNTPEGVKRASGVVDISFWDVSIPASGTMYKLHGEALYLDLGPGARPLIALLTSQLHPKYGKNQRWSRDGGPNFNFLLRLYGEPPIIDNVLAGVSRLARMRGPRSITPDDLPDLVTFADVNDPKSVIEVDPNDLQATLGPNITWNEITLESTAEPVTTGIEPKLPWIPSYWCGMLDGRQYHDGRTLANTLSTADFDQSDEAHERSREKTSHGNISYECWKSVTEWQQRHARG
jgi:hypothetical protein